MRFFKFSLIPGEEKFFILFEQSALNSVKIALQLKDLTYLWENVKERVGTITQFEHQGDAITHQIMALLNSVFITPFDREDIVVLAQSLDDITDCIHAAAESMLIYNVQQPVIEARQLSDIIVQATMEIEKAVGEIRTRIDPEKINRCCIEVNTLQNTGYNLYRSLMGDLFNYTGNIADIIKWREIYGHLEAALARCEDASNVLEGISIKST
jgi:hypothetical protein